MVNYSLHDSKILFIKSVWVLTLKNYIKMDCMANFDATSDTQRLKWMAVNTRLIGGCEIMGHYGVKYLKSSCTAYQ